MISRERCTCGRRARGPRWVDTHQLAGIADSSAKRYRAAAANVADFLVKNFPDAEGGEDLDDALMEWKHMMRPSKTDFELAIATVEFTHARC